MSSNVSHHSLCTDSLQKASLLNLMLSVGPLDSWFCCVSHFTGEAHVKKVVNVSVELQCTS